MPNKSVCGYDGNEIDLDNRVVEPVLNRLKGISQKIRVKGKTAVTAGNFYDVCFFNNTHNFADYIEKLATRYCSTRPDLLVIDLYEADNDGLWEFIHRAKEVIRGIPTILVKRLIGKHFPYESTIEDIIAGEEKDKDKREEKRRQLVKKMLVGRGEKANEAKDKLFDAIIKMTSEDKPDRKLIEAPKPQVYGAGSAGTDYNNFKQPRNLMSWNI